MHCHPRTGRSLVPGRWPPPFPHLRPGRAASSRLRLPQAVSSSPYQGDGRGAASLGLLSVLHRDIHPSLGQRWATTIPLLLEYLDGEGGADPSISDPASASQRQRWPVGTRVL